MLAWVDSSVLLMMTNRARNVMVLLRLRAVAASYNGWTDKTAVLQE